MDSNGVQISNRNFAPNSGQIDPGCRKAILKEDGVVIEMFALCLGLLAVLAFGLALQMPTNQASALRGHHALQAASAAAILSVDDKSAAADTAWKTAQAIVTNGYVAESGAVPTGRFSGDLSNFTVLIPNRTNDQTSDGFFIYNCSGTSCTLGPIGDVSRQVTIASRIFDTPISHEYDVTNPTADGTFDYKNGVMVYAEIEPLTHSIYKNNAKQPVISITMTVPTDVYILVDPAMSMTPQIYDWVFGEQEVAAGYSGPDPYDRNNQFPVVYDREHLNGGPKYYPGGGWEYPPSVGIMRFGPRGEADPTNQRLRNFFASLCFNSPWDLYKGAVVDLIDYLQSSSAYNRSLGVGLVAPFKSLRDKDMSFTAAAASGEDSYNYSPIAHLGMVKYQGGPIGSTTAITTPIAFKDTTQTSQLNSSGTLAGNFQGMVKIFDPYDTNNLANKNYNRLDEGDAGEARNLWSTLVCRGFVTEDNSEFGDPPTYSLTEDRNTTFTPGEEPNGFAGDIFDFRDENTRRRVASAGFNPIWRKWTASWTSSWTSTSVDIADGASGAVIHGVRNLVAGLAPSFLGLQETIKDVAGFTGATGNWTDWSRTKKYKLDGAACNNTYPSYTASYIDPIWMSPDGECNNALDPAGPESAPRPIDDTDISSRMVQDWRDIPSAMRAACEALGDNKAQYMANPFLATERPLGASKLIVFGFGLYSPLTSQTLGMAKGDRQSALAAALTYCSCQKNIEIIFDFLPLSPWDEQTVYEASEVIAQYQRKYDGQCKPMYFPDTPIAGCAQTKSIQFFVNKPADFNDPNALVDAAVKYRDDIKKLKLLFNKFVYKM